MIGIAQRLQAVVWHGDGNADSYKRRSEKGKVLLVELRRGKHSSASACLVYAGFCTIESYGRSETIIGNWLKHQARDKIIGATTMEQLRENIGGCCATLSGEILKDIEALHLRYCHPAP